jgi:two-component system phosphate regulon sensor histidine kinase PhoR
MNHRSLKWHLLVPAFLILTVLTVVLTALIPHAAEGFLIDRARTELTEKAALIAKIAALDHLSTESLGSFLKNCTQTTGTRLTVFLDDGTGLVETTFHPREIVDWNRFPEVRTAREGRVGHHIARDPYIDDRLMAVAVPAGYQAAGTPMVRAVDSIADVDRSIARFRLSLMALAALAAAAWIGCGIRFSRRLGHFLNHLSAALANSEDGAFRLPTTQPPMKEGAVLVDRIVRMAASMEKKIQTIAHERNKIESVLFSMREGVVAVTRDDRIISINPAASGMFDCDKEAALGSSIPEVIRNLQLQRFVSRASESAASLEEDVSFYRSKDIILNLKSSAMMDADGGRIGTLIVMADVTRLRRLENMRSDFVANVSHEIKTPLTAIKGFVETLYHRQVNSREETERFLGIIMKHVNRLDAIVSDLLSLSRVEQSNDRQELQLKKTRIRDIIATVVQVLQAKADAKEITFAVDDHENAAAMADATLMEQALLNLMDNAIKYSHPKGTVGVTVTTSNGELSIQVKDQGVGIAKRHLSRLFERFYRVDKARSRTMGGTGLGLAIVKHIAQAHGGQISVDSTPGRGTTFTLQMPLS